MLADPQSITVNAVAKSLPRINVADGVSTYRTADGDYTLTIGHQFKPNRSRYTVRLDHKSVVTDVFASELNVLNSMSCYMVIDVPNTGWSNTYLGDVTQALVDFMDVSGRITAVIGGET